MLIFLVTVRPPHRARDWTGEAEISASAEEGKAAELLAATQRLAGAVSGDCSAATACSISRTSASSYKLSTIFCHIYHEK